MVISCWLSSWSQQKRSQFLAKVPFLAISGYLGPPSKSIFRTCRQNFKKSSESFLGKAFRDNVLNFEFSSFKKLRGGTSRFASRHSPKSMILASCNFMGRPFVASCAFSIVYFHSSS